MNEIVNIEKYLLKAKVIEKDFYDKYENYRTACEWFDTFKHKFQKTGIKNWNNDVFIATNIPDGETTKINKDKMRETSVYIINGETGELEEINALDFYQQFEYKTPRKAYVQVKEKK